MMKRILSFLLAFLMVVSIIPFNIFAEGDPEPTPPEVEGTSEPTTEPVTDPPCDTCGAYDCESEHLNWCADCRMDDCGQNHCPTCGTIDCTADHGAPAAETPEDPEVHPMVGKYVKLTTSTMFGYVAEPNWSNVIVGSYPAYMEITDVLEKDGVTYYRLKAAPGYDWPTTGGYTDDVVYQESTKLTIVTRCSCGQYDCGVDHTQPTDPTEPENTCECGCESCTGTEGCECKCGECDFCEKEEETTKPEEPTVPSISDTVNGQTVTVTGDALPEGAELVVSEAIVGLDGGFALDIKILDADKNEWQPEKGRMVSVSLSVNGVENGQLVDLVHFLENEQQIQNAVALGEILTGKGIDTILPAAAAALKKVTGKDETVAYEVITGLEVINSQINFETASFSIYTWNGSSYTASSSGSNLKIVMNPTANNDGANGNTYYVTNKHSIYMDCGGYLSSGHKWSTSNDTIGSFSGGNNDKYFNLNGKASLGDKFTISSRIVDIDAWGGKTSTINLVIIEERKVTFNGNGGTPDAASSTAITDGGSHVQKATFPNATRKGYKFLGWYTASSGGTRIGGNGTTYMPESSAGITLYAQWDPIKYTVKFHANGGSNTVTGSMPTLNMTYDVETTLPRNQFVNQGDGMVFLGWATSASGEVVYKDGQKINNLTDTDGGTVNLYAKWKYGLSSTVYIGINNTYHNPKGTYTAGGVTIKSYHVYPNEPAQMTGDFDRVTDDNGAWRYDTASAVPLKNQAASYINGNIFNSPDYEMTYVEGENTLGIAAPTGNAVRSMLKFTEADYNAMIAVWLEGMRTTLVGYGDTSFDWQNAKASDFTIVPYVIKFQNYDSWYIDMVVIPKALYTLAYDGNIENGYTASFTGVAFPPSSQYTDGSTVDVVATPIGYQSNNMKVTKIIDGHTYTATFQYWYDDKGNTYGGSTGKNTIKLTEDTILYAKWNYPDASFGNLNITKTVVDKDAYDNPSTTQNFTFKFTTSASGSYNYMVYDRSANVKASGAIANNGTFTLQDGWRIRITDLPKDATYSVTETAVNYYTASGTVSGTISAGATTYATVTNTYQKHAEYTVKHHLKDAEGDGYTEQTADRQKLYGVIGEKTAAAAKTTYTGYAAKPFAQVAIQKDGSTVIDIYYDVNSHTVKASGDANVTITGDAEQTVSHGQENEPIVFKPKDGYRISKVTINGEEQTGFGETEYTFQQTIDEDVTIYVTTEKAVADLTISISGNTSGQNYVFSVTNSKGDEVNRVVFYADKTSITIRELPVDTYTVTPVSGWAWRQNVSSADANAELPTQDIVTFVCSSNGLVKWLNGFNNDGKKGV